MGETPIVNRVRRTRTIEVLFEPGDTRQQWKGEAAASFVCIGITSSCALPTSSAGYWSPSLTCYVQAPPKRRFPSEVFFFCPLTLRVSYASPPASHALLHCRAPRCAMLQAIFPHTPSSLLRFLRYTRQSRWKGQIDSLCSTPGVAGSPLFSPDFVRAISAWPLTVAQVGALDTRIGSPSIPKTLSSQRNSHAVRVDCSSASASVARCRPG